MVKANCSLSQNAGSFMGFSWSPVAADADHPVRGLQDIDRVACGVFRCG